MAENHLKTGIRRLLRSASCKSKELTDDVVETHQHHSYQLVEVFSPQPHRSFSTFPPLTPEQCFFVTNKANGLFRSNNIPFLSDIDGRKCPPASPIISPLNHTFYQTPNHKTKPKNKKKCTRSITYKKKYHGFAEFQECKYNGLYSSDDDDEDKEDERATFITRRHSSAGVARRRTEPEAAVEADSMAVVKRSSDPYSDFRKSMVEMIVEKQIFAARDLENLLRCFLSLNSYHHHKVIVQVFAEIWEALLM